MDIRDVILFLSAAINTALSGVIIFHNPRSRINISYSLAALSAALWAAGIAVFRLVDFPAALAVARFYYLAAALIASFFLQFALVFPEEPRTKWSLAQVLGFWAPVLFVALLLFGDTFIESYRYAHWGKDIRLGPAYVYYVLYFLGYVGAAFLILGRKFRAASGIAQAQMWFVVVGVGVAMLLGVWFNLLLPLVGNYRLIWAGPPFTVVMVAFIAYAIFKHNLYNIKVIATEAFGALLALVLLVRLFVSVNPADLLVNTAIWGATAVLVVLLIRSVLAEVKSRERIAELAEELGKSNEELRELDAAKSEFISIASHQLRAPLTVIKGYVSMLLEGALGKISGLAHESMQKVYTSSEQLVRLVGDMLDLSRIEAGRMKYDFKRVMMDDVVGEVVRELELAAKAKKLGFRFLNSLLAREAVRADSDKLREVVFNLVDNALKYTAAGRVTVELSSRRAEGRDWVTLKVQDTGIGIQASDVKRMFTKFARTEEAKHIRPDGMGLGLYIVKKIVEDHGGRAWAESPGLGGGSAFYVELPAIP